MKSEGLLPSWWHGFDPGYAASHFSTENHLWTGVVIAEFLNKLAKNLYEGKTHE